MVIRLILFLMLLIPVCSALANDISGKSQLNVSISKTDKQWGQTLHATLRYSGSELLQKIDFDAWNEFVAITHHDESRDKDAAGNITQIKQLRLYPRKRGKYILPALKLGMSFTEPIALDIGDPIVKTSEIQLSSNVSTLSPWQRQAVVIRVTLQTADFSAHVVLDDIKKESVISKTLEPVRQELPGGRYRFESGWVVYPLKAGAISLDLPAVKYQLSGSSRRKFHLPLVDMDVKALPAYLPPTLPVGHLSTNGEIEVDQYWNINIQTDALIPYGVPGLDAQLAALNQRDISKITINNSQFSNGRNHSDYRVPLPEWLMPVGKDLRLKLRYFDPNSGRLEEVSQMLPRQWKMPVWAWWLVVTVGLLAGIFLIWKMTPWIKSLFYRLKLRRQLQAAPSVQALRQIILNDGEYATLSQWTDSTEKRHDVIAELNQHCFSSSENGDLPYFKKVLLQAI